MDAITGPVAQPSETERNDRDAGRQLAFVIIAGAVVFGAFAGWALWDDPRLFTRVSLVGGVPLLLGVIALVFPVHAIRLVMGRWAELLGDHDPSSPLTKIQEGLPLDAALTETVVKTKRGRAWLGIAGMAAGVLGCVLSWGLFDDETGGSIGNACIMLSVIGLIVWYRTL